MLNGPGTPTIPASILEGIVAAHERLLFEESAVELHQMRSRDSEKSLGPGKVMDAMSACSLRDANQCPLRCRLRGEHRTNRAPAVARC